MESKNLGIMGGRFVMFLAGESTVSLRCISMSCAWEASKVWMRETMGWGTWLFDSAVWSEREFMAVRSFQSARSLLNESCLPRYVCFRIHF